MSKTIKQSGNSLVRSLNAINPNKSTIYSDTFEPTYRRILVINGPNLNLLGLREPEIYGSTTLHDIEHRLKLSAENNNIDIICIQSNHEGELVDAIQHHGLTGSNDDLVDAIIINPAAYTHTSVAIRDAILSTQKPFIEVHLSNIHSREDFRAHSYFSDKAIGVICGLGHLGYDMALGYFIHRYQS